jgi:hypothetical protein
MLYSLSDIYAILQNGIEYTLPTSIVTNIQNIEKEINNSSIKKMYSIPVLNTPSNTSNYSSNMVRNRDRDRDRDSRPTMNKIKKYPEESELSWDNIRNFKITKIEKKEGTDKYINDIRICINKMSNKNYDTQKTTILEYIHKLTTEMESPEELQKVATAIFDIASTNKFYSEMYAKIYKELIDLYPVFREILDGFLLQFLNTLSDLKYVDPNVDYDAFCNYNKQNDRKKATAVFIIHMMKQEVILPSIVLNILHYLLQNIENNMDLSDHINEIEEMTELVNLFILEGFVFISNFFVATNTYLESESEKESWLENISKCRVFSQLKVKDKKSLSSRIIFKYMDICTFMDKNA